MVQQIAKAATVRNCVDLLCRLRLTKRLETFSHYPTINDADYYKLSVQVLSDVGKQNERGQFAYVDGLLIDILSIGSVLHA